MASDKLYAAAFQYKKTKIWKKLWDDNIFAVRMPDGELGYICVMGASGEYCALGVYIGDRGFQSYRKLVEFSGEEMSYFEERELMASQECLQLTLENKENLSDEEIAEVRAYTKANGIRLAGKNAWPQFAKYQKNRCPWKLGTDQEEEYLLTAISAALDLAEILKTASPYEVGIVEMKDTTDKIPLMEQKDGIYCFTGTVSLPKPAGSDYARPKHLNEIAIRTIKRYKKKGILECEIILFPEPIQNHPEEAPFFAHMLMAVESKSFYILPPAPIGDYEENPDEMMAHFIEMLQQQKICPRGFKVRDERTFAFLEELSKKLMIPITMEKELEALDDAEYHMLEHLANTNSMGNEREDFWGMIDALLEMTPSEIRNMPPELFRQLEMLLDLLPEDIADELAEKFDL